MNRKLLAILPVTILFASCSGQAVTQTATVTETTSQYRTITKTETVTQNPVTHTVYVTTTVFIDNEQQEPTTSSPQVPTTSTQVQTPVDYTTYTNSGLFSISYPSDWELLNYLLEDLDGLVDDVLSSIDSGFPLDQASYIFFAGLPTDTDWVPSINIVIESLPFSASSIQEVVNAEVLGIQQFIDSYTEISRQYVQVDGREAAIVYWEGMNELGTFSSFQGYLFIDDLVWIITLTPPPGEYGLWEEDFYNIAASFRYLK